MPIHSFQEETRTSETPSSEAPVWSVVVAVAIVVAAWIAAGSTGVLADPLRRVLTWVALTVALGAGAPRPSAGWQKGIALAAAVLVGLLMTAAPQPEAQVLAVALVGAAIAWCHRDLPRRVVLLGALAAAVLAIARIAIGAVPVLWLAADGLADGIGRLAGALAGEPLTVGSTYAGLDFLLVVAVMYAGWLLGTPAPRLRRGLLAAVAVVLGHLAYLVVLAHTETIVAMLPERTLPATADDSLRDLLGVWTWGNAARRLLPWNVPLLAAAIHGTILVLMFRWSWWLPVVDPEPEPDEKEKRRRDEELAGTALLADMALRFGPVMLALLLPATGWLATCSSDLKGKTIVAYEEGYLDWLKPTHDNPSFLADGSFGLLPVLVESLGGTFVRSAELSAADLQRADVVVLLHPDQPWQPEQLDRLWDYVRGGGSLLLAAEPRVAQRDSVSSFDEVLQPAAIRVHDDTAIGHQPNCQDSFQPLSHPATPGIDTRWGGFGFRYGSSLHAGWRARPVLVGRYGYGNPGSDAAITSVYRYQSGHRLGDLVVAAEQPFGAGRIFVLGDTSSLANQMLVQSYEFTGRLLGYLAGRGGTPQAGWRQLITFLIAASLIVLLCWRPAAPQIGLSAAVLAATLAATVATSHQTSRVLPDGRGQKPRNNVAYITATHAEFFGREPFAPAGLGSLNRSLMRNGYLPLLMPDFTNDRLERAGLLITIAPARPFSRAEIAKIERFVQQGGHFICMVGAEEARPSAPLLDALGFRVAPSPVHPGEDIREPIPLGSYLQPYHQEGAFIASLQVWNGWPVESDESDARTLPFKLVDGPDVEVVLYRHLGAGTATVIGDSYFALNRNYESLAEPTTNDQFWRWLIARLAGPKPWYPRPPEAAAGQAEMPDDTEMPDDETESPDDEDASEPAVMEESPLAVPDLMEPDAGLREPDAGLREPDAALRMPDDDAADEGMPQPPGLEPPAETDELKIPERFERLLPPEDEPLSLP
ncbi:MAG: hypothetical protein RBS80_00290 [Thermoguttaceae bacterium]|jgi:hypothetical protein|nr:hypothetical protein [Thermoguttaceae bacterium]